jgi:hypothetical protein
MIKKTAAPTRFLTSGKWRLRFQRYKRLAIIRSLGNERKRAVQSRRDDTLLTVGFSLRTGQKHASACRAGCRLFPEIPTMLRTKTCFYFLPNFNPTGLTSNHKIINHLKIFNLALVICKSLFNFATKIFMENTQMIVQNLFIKTARNPCCVRDLFVSLHNTTQHIPLI